MTVREARLYGNRAAASPRLTTSRVSDCHCPSSRRQSKVTALSLRWPLESGRTLLMRMRSEMDMRASSGLRPAVDPFREHDGVGFVVADRLVERAGLEILAADQ